MTPTPSEQLRFLANARREYLHGKEPETASDIEAMSISDLMIWVQSKTAEDLARYLEDSLEDSDAAWGWLPSWREPEWKRFTAGSEPTA